MTNNSSLFNLICLCFSDETIECFRFSDDVALSRAIYREEYHAIFVDAATGIDANRAVFARRACYGDRRAPLIVVGAFDGRDGIEQAFNAGADDVVRSPVDRHELAARTQFALRRFQSGTAPRCDDCVEYGPYRLDRRTGAVLLDDQEIRLTVREFAIAWLLFSQAGDYVSRRTIAGAIWSSTEDIVGRTLEQHIYKLRKKLNLNGATGVQLRTMYAHGYRIELCDGRAESEAVVQPVAPVAVVLAEVPQRASGAIATLLESAGPGAPARAAAHKPHAVTSRSGRALDVHSKDSETARNALPWAQYATFWHQTLPVNRAVQEGINASYGIAPEPVDTTEGPPFAVPGPLLVHSRGRG